MECASGAKRCQQHQIAHIAVKIAEMMMSNISGKMDDVTLENGRRKIARECRDKIKQLKNSAINKAQQYSKITYLNFN